MGLDPEGRITQVTASTGQNPVTGVIYNPYGNPAPPSQTITFGSGDSDVFNYDPNTNRMTGYQFNVGGAGQSDIGKLTWNANSTLQQLVITDAFNSGDNQTCNYGYDDVVRLTSVNCGSVETQTFTYDPFGNINKAGNPGQSFNPIYSITRNRISTVGSTTAQYDNNGNVLTDGVHNYTWDADGNSITVDSVGATFDALDRMVEQNRAGVYSQIVYSPTGGKLVLMSGQTLQKAFVPLPGKATAVYTSAGLTYYRHSDWLGNARLTSTSTGGASTPGTGSATVSGSEQNQGGSSATPGTGSVSFSGTLQSKQILTQAATAGTGTVTVSGSERSTTTGGTYASGSIGFASVSSSTQTVTVGGSYKLTFNFPMPPNTPPATTIAQAVASAMNSLPIVSAVQAGSGVNITAKTVGPGGDYTVTSTGFSNNPSTTLSGGSNGTTIYDTGTVSVKVNGVAAGSATYGQSSTPTNIASALVTSINSTSPYVTATSSGATITLTAKTTGSGTNYSVSTSCGTTEGSYFSGCSFSASGSALTGGANAVYTTRYDSGTSTITVNSHADTVSWSGSGIGSLCSGRAAASILMVMPDEHSQKSCISEGELFRD